MNRSILFSILMVFAADAVSAQLRATHPQHMTQNVIGRTATVSPRVRSNWIPLVEPARRDNRVFDNQRIVVTRFTRSLYNRPNRYSQNDNIRQSIQQRQAATRNP